MTAIRGERCGRDIPYEKGVNRRVKRQKTFIVPPVRESTDYQREIILDHLV